MNDTVIEKRESRSSKSKEWRMSNGNGHFLDVIFSIDLENRLRSHRNFSFARFESEQLNKLSGIIPSLQDDYRLTIDEKAVGLAFLPIGIVKMRFPSQNFASLVGACDQRVRITAATRCHFGRDRFARNVSCSFNDFKVGKSGRRTKVEGI